MSDEFNVNEVVASFMKQNIENFVQAGKDVIKSAGDKLSLHLDRTYKEYLSNIMEKHSKVKSFLLRGDPVHLYQFYVPISLKHGTSVIEHANLASMFGVSRCCTVVGSGGSGKSMFMRHLLLDSIITHFKVPIFIELRQFNDNGNDLFELINKTLALYKLNLGREYIDKAFTAGHFIVFLDGFDEIVHSKRQLISRTIQEFSKKNDKNIFIMSSRPDSELEGWQDFALLKVHPLSLALATELVARSPFDEELKRNFLKDLKEDLFERHKSFLSNPLLLSIMLLTYGQSASIPNKLNVFYNQAYEALFDRHDALKGGYTRDHLTKLDIQDFARIYSSFCLLTYDKRKFELSKVEALEYVEKAKEISGIEFNKSDYLKDLLQSVCLLIEDGLVVGFSHRSFQEYFAARFVAESKPVVQRNLIKKYSKNIRSDGVMSLLYEMRPEIVEQYFVLPALKGLFKIIGVKRKDVAMIHYYNYIKESFESLTITKDNFFATNNAKSTPPLSDIASFTLYSCGNIVGWKGFTGLSECHTFLTRKYVVDGKEVKFEIDKVKANDTIVADLAEKGKFFSIETLRLLKKIQLALEKKHARSEATLEEILKKK